MSGNPTDGEILWYLNGQIIITTAEGNYMKSGDKLAILHMSAKTSGNYTCLLDNGIPGSKGESPYYQGMKTEFNEGVLFVSIYTLYMHIYGFSNEINVSFNRFIYCF